MKKWHAKPIGECDVHRDIYEEGNPKPIAERIMFDAANALVAAHNEEQEELVNATPTPQGQSRSETGATGSDKQIAQELADQLYATFKSVLNCVQVEYIRDKYILPAITRANKARAPKDEHDRTH